MSLLDLNTDETISALPLRLDVPKPAPERKFSAWRSITAPVRGVVEAAAQVLGSTADVLGGFGQVLGAYPEAAGISPSGDQRKQADAQRARLLADGVDMSSEAGDLFRDTGRGYRPDPTTAHAAEQALYGFARGGSKVIAGAVVGGIPGVMLAGAEESMSAADDLKREGVGLGARTAAGAVQGAGLALAALPAAGQTLRGTLALYAAGGPGGYVAQQALTREILQRGGFDKQAEQFDPLDPVGLAVSALIPAPFAAFGLRTNRRAAAEAFRTGPAPSEPTAVASAVQEAMPRELVDAAMVTHLADVRQRADSAAVMMAGESRVVPTLAQFVEAGKWKAAEPMKAEPADTFGAWLRSQGGIDIAEKVDITGEANNVRANPGGVFRRGGLPSDELASRAAEAGFMLPEQAGNTRGFVDLVQGMLRGERVLTLEQQNDAAMRSLEAAKQEARLADLEGRLQLLGEDPAAARGNADAMDAYLQANQHRLLGAALDEVAARPDATDLPQFDALRERARQVAEDMRDTDRTLAQYEAELQPLSPVMRKLVQEALTDATTTPKTPNPEAAAPARGAGEPAPAAGAAEPGRSAGVEAAGLTPGDKAEGAAVQARLDAIQAERPDMMVMLDGMDKPMPLAEFLVAMKAEADELLADAPLVELAAQCALVNGP